MTGHLHLVCSLDDQARTFVREQSFAAPVHLSKPHLDGDTLVVNVANPTPGFLAGDRVRYDVTVESGARVLLTAPSASRAHRVLAGDARLAQIFRVNAGAWLDSWPELFIPQAGARYRQETTLQVAEGGEALLIEMIAPGRTASGELFAFSELEWETDIHFGGRKVARERYRLTPQSLALTEMRARFVEPYYASAFLIGRRLDGNAPCWRRIHDLQSDSVWIGCSALQSGGWAMRIVTAGSITLRQTVAALRSELYSALDHPLPALRRNV